MPGVLDACFGVICAPFPSTVRYIVSNRFMEVYERGNYWSMVDCAYRIHLRVALRGLVFRSLEAGHPTVMRLAGSMLRIQPMISRTFSGFIHPIQQVPSPSSSACSTRCSRGTGLGSYDRQPVRCLTKLMNGSCS